MEILNKIQKELKAPKTQKNKHGGYSYRSCEDILEAVKPLLGKAILTVTDEIVLVCGAVGQNITVEKSDNKSDTKTTYTFPDSRYYVKATATIEHEDDTVSVSAFAREAFEQKGMGSAQLTCSTSSYARKCALNGLFAIDDSKEQDSPLEEPPTPNEKQMEFLNTVWDKLADSAPEGMRLDADKVGKFIYALLGEYPDDLKRVSGTVGFILGTSENSKGKNQIATLCNVQE